MHPHHVLVTVTGFDRPGVASALFAALAAHDVEVLDVEQVVVSRRLALGAALALHGDPAALRRAATGAAEALGVQVEVSLAEEPEAGSGGAGTDDPSAAEPARHNVVVLGRPLRAGVVALVARCVTDLGGNIESISRVADERVTGLELVVSGVDHRRLCGTLTAAAAETGTDIAVERSDRGRLAKRLVLVDVDSTLLRGDVFGLLADLAGQGGARAGAGPAARDGADSPREWSARLAGLPQSAFAAVRDRVRVEPGTRNLVAALTRLGFRCGAVSAAPAQVVEPMLDRVGLDLVAANRLEVAAGRLTGRLVGGPVDGPGKARALRRFAEAYGVPLSQTVAVAAGGDVDLLALAGLGVTLHPAPAAEGRAAPGRGGYLDGLLVVLGMAGAGMAEPGADLAGAAVSRPPARR
jgi:phosphoserine phosphatase